MNDNQQTEVQRRAAENALDALKSAVRAIVVAQREIGSLSALTAPQARDANQFIGLARMSLGIIGDKIGSTIRVELPS